MNATTLRRRLRDLKLAEELVKTAREDIKNVNKDEIFQLLNDLANIEVAINQAHESLNKQLKLLGFI